MENDVKIFKRVELPQKESGARESIVKFLAVLWDCGKLGMEFYESIIFSSVARAKYLLHIGKFQ